MLEAGVSKKALAASFAASIWVATAAHAQQAAANEPPGTEAAPAGERAVEEIIVTARKRAESLMTVPVSVSALGSIQIERYNAVDLAGIAQLMPGVSVSTTGSTGGASLNIRGISTSATVTGFEQAVSVAIDGIQTSNGRIATFGFFDVAQVEVLKGPQALFFGRNSPAGVISLKTKGPTNHLEVEGGVDYEFVAREVTAKTAVSGPISDRLGARLAVQYRHMRGWLDNVAQSLPNPFYTSAQPAGAAIIPAPSSRHNEVSEYSGRLTLNYEVSDQISASFKAFGQYKEDNGPSFNGGQNIGPCPSGLPSYFGVSDPFGECVQDNRISAANFPQAVADRIQLTDGKSAPWGESDAQMLSLSLTGDFDKISIVSNTGYNRINYKASYDQSTTSLAQTFVGERSFTGEFTQELRAQSKFDGAVNVVIGGYFQNVKSDYFSSLMLFMNQYDPVLDVYELYRRSSKQNGNTYSLFGQLILELDPTVQLTAGARYTKETKDYRSSNPFGRLIYDTSNTLFPGSDELGVLKGKFRDSNISPEVTLSWNPSGDSTLYASYRTGYKSGGFLLGGLLNVNSNIDAFDFDSEKVKGFEVGAKGYFVDRKLRLAATAFAYDFSGLQVNALNPAIVAYVVSNAGGLRQRGVDLEANFVVSRNFSLHGSATYVRNRFKNYVGQCYTFGFPAGTTPATATPPPGCSFVNDTSLTLQQDFDGRAPARSPEFTANFGFVAEHEVGELKLGATGDVFYSDSYFASETQSPFSRQPSFARLNGTVSISDIDDRWKVALVGKNLTNKYYLILGADSTGGTGTGFGQQRGFVARGREIALQTSFKF